MTRFARAKGSKASNERVPETATPWNIMKADLKKTQDEAKNQTERKKIHEERQKNYDEFVKETESKVDKKWAEFPKTNLKSIKKNKMVKKKNKSLLQLTEADVTDDMIQEMCQSDPEIDGELQNMTKKIEQVLKKKQNKVQTKPAENGDGNNSDDAPEVLKKKQNKVQTKTAENGDGNNSDDAPEETTTKVVPQKINAKKAKNKKTALKIVVPPDTQQQSATELPTPNKKVNKQKQDENQQKNNNKQRENKNQQKNNHKQGENKKPFDKDNKLNNKTENQPQKRKLPKERDNLEHKRRKPETENTIKVNGELQQIILYMGFPVLKSDHDRLVDLRKSLVSKGIPKSEVNKTMKLERRKAEKYLNRVKKVVCYQCRESGHLLSECPELENINGKSLVDTTATGICFKCGSTEHNYKECKVSRDFNFAKCFICREQGHISSQCPDNPKGLYPKGGACKLCGDVTHLKKDCPKYVDEQKTNEIFLNTISNGNIESIDNNIPVKKQNAPQKKKVVKF